jgi:hypothetical protein
VTVPTNNVKTDAKGYIVGDTPRAHRIFVAVRAPELRALERSGDPSLRKLAERVHGALAIRKAEWEARVKRGQELERLSREENARIEADPVARAERDRKREELADAMRGPLGSFLGRRKP